MTDRTARIQRLILAAAFIMLFLFSAVRWNVGTDTWHTYTPEYLAMKAQDTMLTTEEEQIVDNCFRVWCRFEKGTSVENAKLLTHKEAISFYAKSSSHTAVGFRVMERLLLFLGADVQWLYVVTSAFVLVFVFASIRRQSTTPLLALVMFILTGSFFLSLNIVAQFMAISVCLYACSFAQQRKPLPFFFLIVLAACFHISALVFIPVYFLPKLNIKPYWCMIVIAVFLAGARFCFPFLERTVTAVAPAYARYFTKDVDFEWIFFAIGLAVFAVGTWYYPRGKDRPYYRLWYYANVLGLIALCFSGHIPYMKRINYYFAAPHFLFLPLVLECEEKHVWRRMITVVMIVFFFVETFVATGLMNKNGTLPYQMFFQRDRISMTESLLEHIPGLW